ncbi:hypothetical protein SAMN02745181_2030 [Rubritalea squalenifaciens DSM 18772]|uniref:Uncharacterized protein n=1 Tax=Rubritalea squalenifaciens DSM 18772 TaxID=1123071 RepID=A0A1M6J7A8_9BACT|nr:hypothetical protein [Rubritalea squalenifaciens]SHJ42576.1 hypothetical protein SAMN02745181_2030 [Rubritalea squalenifaciens DSM 18772]
MPETFTGSAPSLTDMLATESILTIPLPSSLVQEINSASDAWASSLGDLLESAPSPMVPILNHYKRSKSTTILPDKVRLLEVTRTGSDTLTLVIEFQEYQYRGHVSFFYLDHYTQKLRASISFGTSELQFKVLHFPAPLHDC